MQWIPTPLSDAYMLKLEALSDTRGFFARMFCEKEFTEKGVDGKCLQANTSYSRAKGTLRGMHYQLPPFAETKLVRCIRGALYDVILDLRPNSSTFGQWFATELTEENRYMLVIPQGCAHGFMTLKDHTEILYFVSAPYSQSHEKGVRFDDPKFAISWPEAPQHLSEKDQNYPNFTFDTHLTL